MTTIRRTLHRSIPIVALLAAFAAMPSAASAAFGSATTCAPDKFIHAFARWGDPSDYALAAGGSIEGRLAGWQLTGSARQVPGNEPYFLNSAADRYSLLLSGGSSATTRPLCAGLIQPTMRFVAHGSRGSLLKVELILAHAQGGTVSAPIGVVTGTGSWQPSLPMVVGGLPVTVGNSREGLAFRFTPLTGSWNIDDVYVDPYRQR